MLSNTYTNLIRIIYGVLAGIPLITKYNILAKKVGELTGDTDIILVYDEKK
ncbi:MAG: hypothetical protein PWQ59_1478 [Thermoanaerobacterium sp.]|nr:hypothetical protein [Thermoanaerobacterium sp.]MDK2905065.1 hypothetical protein [Eubacteriaceae bacterium]